MFAATVRLPQPMLAFYHGVGKIFILLRRGQAVGREGSGVSGQVAHGR